MKSEQTSSRVLVSLSLMLMSRPRFRLRERLCPGGPLVDKPFVGKLFDNIKACGFPEEKQDELLAVTIAAVGADGPDKRAELCNRAMDILEEAA